MNPAETVQAIRPEENASKMAALNAEWRLSDDAKTLHRRFEFKGYAKAVHLSQLVAWLASEQGHQNGDMQKS